LEGEPAGAWQASKKDKQAAQINFMMVFFYKKVENYANHNQPGAPP
jgi:hypothetical protein